jgi:hypothetical protein
LLARSAVELLYSFNTESLRVPKSVHMLQTAPTGTVKEYRSASPDVEIVPAELPKYGEVPLKVISVPVISYVPLATALSVIPRLKAFAFSVVVLVKVSGRL